MSNPTNKLIDIKIRYDAKCNQHYLEARYETNKRDGIHERCYSMPIHVFSDLPYLERYEGISTIDFGFCTLCADTGLVIEDHLVSPRVEKMTIADIEELLGYKIELVEEMEI